MNNKIYLILLVDRKRARMFTIQNGIVITHKEFSNDEAPSKVKHGENAWDAQDKINRHVDEHLHRHLVHVTKEVQEYIKKERVDAIIIGGHKPLFRKVKGHLKYPLDKKVLGNFVTELKVPQEEVFRRAMNLIEKIETENEEEQMRNALS